MSDHQINGDTAHQTQRPYLTAEEARRQQADEELRRAREAAAKAKQPVPATG
ncbi:hypothetical protein ACEZDB_35930 [Streptacidiphilus sp. N1-3]|uniref:Uncharacterized protein n=1 Tax=Streptacidiphilus alkalitolerans TaxID=3342712 RepID=A0ABV6XCW8_9ACTN